MTKIFEAIDFAQKAHSGQFRKGTPIPYIIHPLEVMKILLQFTDDENVIIAGILHDTLEDTETREEEILQFFGQEVLTLVKSATEAEKDKSWEERKQHTLEYLSQTNDKRVLLLTCADKLNNINSIINDYNQIGEEIWKRFKRGKEQQKWYYTSLAEIYLNKDKANPLFQKFYQKVLSFFK